MISGRFHLKPLPLGAVALIVLAAVLPADGGPSDAEGTVVRFVDGNERVFAVGQPAQFESHRGAVAYLSRIAEALKKERPTWSGGWKLSVFTDSKLAVYKDDAPPAALMDGSWALSYIAEYTARDGKLVIFPTDPKRMKTRVIRLGSPPKK